MSLSVMCASSGILSSESSSHATSESTALASGCLALGGGMTRPWSLRTAFSKSSGFLATLAAVMPSKLTPPSLPLSLWQPEQYCLMVASCASGEGAGAWASLTTQVKPRTAITGIEFLRYRIVVISPVSVFADLLRCAPKPPERAAAAKIGHPTLRGRVCGNGGLSIGRLDRKSVGEGK